MTPDQACAIITRDHGAIQINSVADLVAALNSLGLLAYAADPQSSAIDPAAETLAVNQMTATDWATKRQR